MSSDIPISRNTMILSICFHLLVVLSFTIAWPFVSAPPTTAQPLVIVDLIQKAPQTNLRSAPKQAPKTSEIEQKETKKRVPPPPPPPPAPPQAKPVIEQAKTTAPPPKPKPAPDVEILPDKKVQQPKAKPKPKAPQAKKVTQPASRPAAPAPKTPAPKPNPVAKASVVKAPPARPNKLIKKSQQKEKVQALSGVLQNLADVSKAEKAEKNQKAKQKQQAQDKLKSSLSQAVSDQGKAEEQKQLKLGQSDFDRLRAHISQCWAPPLGAKGAANLKVDILLELERDGKVRKAEILNVNRYNADKGYKVAADAALRAVIGCGNLPLPADKYELWKKFIFGFDPKFM